MDNLLDNAVKYGEPGDADPGSRDQRDGAVLFAVEDPGRASRAEDLPHVFEPFYRSAAARAAGVRGVGLGLSVARRIAEAMGAGLTVESEPGRGGRFVVRFPAQSSSSSSTS